MRRLTIIVSAGFFALGVVSVTTLAAGAQTAGQWSSPPESGSTGISQGTVTGASASQLEAARQKMAEEDSLPDYSQVVDNTTAGRFAAPGWKTGGTDDLAHGGSYAASTAGAKDARFKLKVPTSSTYSVYAWWPVKAGNSASARFGVSTASGTKWSTVDQTVEGGTWIPIGTYDMMAGDRYAVSVSSGGSGAAVADAVALVRGAASPPPEDLAPADGGATSAGVGLKSDDVTYSASRRKGRVTGRQLIRRGRQHMGTRYRLSPPAPCIAFRVEDCSCFTRNVFRKWKMMRDNPVTQWRYGHRVRSKARLRLGDLVFFKENGYRGPITHVGMYSGNGNILHASNYWGKVVNSKMKYLRGYYGAKRVRPPR